MDKVFFSAVLEQFGATATGIALPEDKVLALGAGKRVAVVATLGSYSYRTTVGPYRGQYLMPVSAEHRDGAGIKAGDTVKVTLRVDSESRKLDLPPDLTAALKGHKAARDFFASLAPTYQKAYITWIESAKKPETRATRVERAAQALIGGRKSYSG
jgi:hypothetical protein